MEWELGLYYTLLLAVLLSRMYLSLPYTNIYDR
jgi:hypothetical protein